MNTQKFALQVPLLAMMLFIRLCGPVGAQLYTVEGHATRRIFTGDTREFEFTVTVSNCAWGIELVQTSLPKEETDTVRHRQAFNGRTLVSYSYEPSGRRTEARGIAKIEESSVVDAAGMAPINLIWLAYASRCVLERAQPGRLPDFSESQTLTDRKPDSLRRASWELSTQAPRLPKWVRVFYDEGGSPPSRAPVDHAEPAVYLSYSAAAFTNLHTMTLPMAFAADILAVQSNPPRPKVTNASVQAWTDRVHSGVRTNLLDVHEPGPWFVQDVRFADGHQEGLVLYQVTNTVPLDTTTEAMQQVKKQARSQITDALPRRDQVSQPRLPLRTLLIVVGSLLAGAGAMKFRPGRAER